MFLNALCSLGLHLDVVNIEKLLLIFNCIFLCNRYNKKLKSKWNFWMNGTIPVLNKFHSWSGSQNWKLSLNPVAGWWGRGGGLSSGLVSNIEWYPSHPARQLWSGACKQCWGCARPCWHTGTGGHSSLHHWHHSRLSWSSSSAPGTGLWSMVYVITEWRGRECSSVHYSYHPAQLWHREGGHPIP